MKKLPILFTAATVLTMVGTAVSAQENTHGRDEHVAPHPINPVVVTGTGTHSRVSETPIPVKVITADELITSGVNTLESALLKLDPSFSVTALGTMGNTLSMNGLEGKYILFLVNGQRMIGSGNDAPDLSRIDLGNVRRIEILDGAASTLYGSDAIAGVVNIITEDGRGGVELSVRNSVRSHGRREHSVNLDAKEGRLGTYISYTHQRQGNWNLSDIEHALDVDAEGNTIGKKDVPTTHFASFAQQSDNFSQRVTYDFSRRLSAYAEGSIYDFRQDRPLTIGDRDTEYAYNMLHYNHTYGAGLSYTVSGRMTLFADFYSDNYTSRYGYTRKSGDFKPGDRQTRLATKFSQTTVKGIFNLGAHKLSVGAEHLSDRLSDFVSGATTMAEPVSSFTLALFAQDEIRISQHFQAVVGGRIIEHQELGTHATPTAAVMYSLGNLRIRAAYANGYKTPALSDIHTHYISSRGVLTIGNTNLRPERSNYGSLGVEYTTGRITVAATGYVNHLRDKVESESFTIEKSELADYQAKYGAGVKSTTINRRANIDRARIVGASVRTKADLGAGFMVNAAYTYTEGKDFATDKRLDKLIPHAASIGASWSKTWGKYRLDVDLDGRYSARRYSTTYSPRVGDAPAYTLWDLNTTHTFRLGNVVLCPSLGVENIFNYRDERPSYQYYVNDKGAGATTFSPYATLTPGRTIYFALTVKFRK